MTAPPPSKTWKKASTQPIHLGWYERRYPLIQGNHPHPCPFDFWNGTAWLAGFPDNQGDTLPSGQKVQATAIANDQRLPWRLPSTISHDRRPCT